MAYQSDENFRECVDTRGLQLTFVRLGRRNVFLVTFPPPPRLTGCASFCAFLTSRSTSLTRAVRWRNSSAFDAATCCFLAFSWATTALERRELGRSTRPGLAFERVVRVGGCIAECRGLVGLSGLTAVWILYFIFHGRETALTFVFE